MNILPRDIDLDLNLDKGGVGGCKFWVDSLFDCGTVSTFRLDELEKSSAGAGDGEPF